MIFQSNPAVLRTTERPEGNVTLTPELEVFLWGRVMILVCEVGATVLVLVLVIMTALEPPGIVEPDEIWAEELVWIVKALIKAVDEEVLEVAWVVEAAAWYRVGAITGAFWMRLWGEAGERLSSAFWYLSESTVSA
jgi:hypothetical protein